MTFADFQQHINELKKNAIHELEPMSGFQKARRRVELAKQLAELADGLVCTSDQKPLVMQMIKNAMGEISQA